MKNKKLLKNLQARHEQRLTELRGQIESGEVREADLESVQNEIDTLIDELKDIKAELDDEPADPHLQIQMMQKVAMLRILAMMNQSIHQPMIQMLALKKIVQA